MQTPGPQGRTRGRAPPPALRSWAGGYPQAPPCSEAAPLTYLLTRGFCPRGLASRGEMGVAKGPVPRMQALGIETSPLDPAKGDIRPALSHEAEAN